MAGSSARVSPEQVSVLTIGTKAFFSNGIEVCKIIVVTVLVLNHPLESQFYVLQISFENPNLPLSINPAVQGLCDRPTHSGGMQRPRHLGPFSVREG